MTPNELTPIDDDLLAALLAEEAALAEGIDAGNETRSGLRECLRLLRTLGPEADGGANSSSEHLRFGRFTLETELGRGGFGIVYLAHDPLLGRSVAIKIPRPELIASAEVQRRFLREARAAGGLDHPNIVPVLDAGPLGPVCFIASAYCPGPTLTQWLKQQTDPVSPRLAARMIAELASAVQHAHERGVLHRDIKPSNVILSPSRSDAVEPPHDDSFTPRLTDFGLAKFVDETGDDTRPMTVIGSPPYMAPEQAAGRHSEGGQSIDVYALGAIFYETLVGRPPFLGETRSETLRLVIDAEPVAPRSLRPRLPRDLEIITLTCLEKSPERRYRSAEALREDLERYLAGQPIKARPVSLSRRALSRIRRHPTLSASGGILLLAFVGLVALLAWSNGRQRESIIRLEAEKGRADAHSNEAGRQRSLAERRLRGTRMMLASQALDDHKVELAQDILKDIRPLEGEDEGSSFAGRLLRDRAYRDVVPLYGHMRDVEGLAFASDGKTLFSGDREGVIKLWDLDLADGRLVATLTGHTLPVKQFVFSKNGRHLLSVASSFSSTESEVFLWDLTTRRFVASLEGVADWSVDDVVIDPADTGFWVYQYSASNPESELLRFDLKPTPSQPRLLESRRTTNQAHLLPNGRTLDLVVEDPAETDRWEAAGANRRFTEWITPGNRTVQGPFASSPDGKTVVTAIQGGDLVCRDTTTGAVVARCTPDGSAFRLEFSPNGQVLAEGSDEGTVLLWNPLTNRRVSLRLSDQRRFKPVHVFAFSPDGSKFAASEWAIPGGATAVTVWEVETGRKLAEYPGRRDRVANLRFAPDGRSLFIASGPTLRRWMFARGTEPLNVSRHSGEAWAIAFNRVDGSLASGADDERESKTIKLWDPASGKEIKAWGAGDGTVSALSFSSDGRWLASSHFAPSSNVRVWDAKTGALAATLSGHVGRVRDVAFQPGGSLLATAGSDCTVRLWDVTTERCVREFQGHTLTVQSLAFEPGGHRLASSASDGSVRLWDIDKGLCAAVLHGAEKFSAVAFSLDGTTLAAADEDGEVTLWDPATLERRAVVRGESGIVRALAFSPDHRELAVAGETGTIEIWEHRIGQRLLKIQVGEGPIHSVSFSPDGTTLGAASHSGVVTILRPAAHPSR